MPSAQRLPVESRPWDPPGRCPRHHPRPCPGAVRLSRPEPDRGQRRGLVAPTVARCGREPVRL